ncbi:hypothetical protein NFI96_006517 [Prochilodus magdalenae]|nr:hypothetical protein NFI96_006517 [Prochilodus magdalenae]
MIPLITTFSKGSVLLNRSLKENFEKFMSVDRVLDHHRVISAYRKNPNLGDLLETAIPSLIDEPRAETGCKTPAVVEVHAKNAISPQTEESNQDPPATPTQTANVAPELPKTPQDTGVPGDILLPLDPLASSPREELEVSRLSPLSIELVKVQTDPPATFKPVKHLSTKRKLLTWAFRSHKPMCIIGDSNLARIPEHTFGDVQIDSYPSFRLDQGKRPDPPEPSCVSMKSDHSKSNGIYFRKYFSSTDLSLTQRKRPDPTEPSCVSMKSDQSIDELINYREDTSSTDLRVQKKTSDTTRRNMEIIFKDAYTATPLPPLGKSDHNLVYLQPQYKPWVRTQPITTRSFRKWSPGAEAALWDCFESTEWSVLQEPYGEDIEGITHCMNFCMDVAVPVKTVRCFANNKPWKTSSVKGLLNKKKRAFKDNNQEELRSTQRELKVHLREAKESYRRKVEQKLRENNMREVWSGMKTITGYMQRTDSATDAPDTSVSDCLDINTSPTPSVIHAPLPQADSSDNTAPVPPFSDLVSSDLTCSTTEAHTSPLLHTFTADQVRGELRRFHTEKAAGPDRVCPRLLKSCAAELGAPLQHIFNLSLRLGRVPTLWKTSCLVPVPKKGRPTELNDFRPVALTSHVMKTLECHLLRPQVQHAMDPLQFAYRKKVGVEDAMLYFLHRAHSHLDKGGSAVRVMFFDFSSAFNTIQPLRLKDKLARMQVDPHLVSWITDYLTGRPQYVRLKDCTSETVVSSTGAPQGTVLSSFLFTLYTSDFRYNSETCHMQKFSDDTAIVACVRGGQEVEYRNLVEDFVAWCHRYNLLLNTSKTKEMVVDFRRVRPLTQPVFIEGVEVEMVRTYRYLGLHLDERLDWSANTDILYRKGRSRLYFLRRLGSFNICRKLLQMFYQTVVSSCLFYAVVCWEEASRRETRCELEHKVISLVKRQLKMFVKLLSLEYPACSEREVEDKEDQLGVRDGALKITLTVLRNMDQTDLANMLQNKLAPSSHRKLKLTLKEKFQKINEGISKHGTSTLLNEIYTELYITEGGSGGVNTEHEVRQIETASRRPAAQEIPIKCNDLFKDQSIRTVLTKGVAGIGKTVSVQKFILDWAEGKANQDVLFIFPLPFRELNLMKEKKFGLVDLLHQFFRDTKELKPGDYDRYKVLFIFDGLDECRLPLDFQNNQSLFDATQSASVDVLLTNLIKGNLLPSALLWITTRPAAANQIPPECVDQVTEVRGFSDPQKEEYFRKRISDQDLAERVISHMKSSKSLYIMCHIPVFCWISATVLERVLGGAGGGEIPKTLTQMFTHFLIFQIKHRVQKYHGTCDPDPQQTRESILALGKLAFQQLEKGNLIFYEEDLRKCGIDVREVLVYSGVCTQIFREEFGLHLGKVFSFVHLSVQEFLAALYAFISFISKNRNVLLTGFSGFFRQQYLLTMFNFLKSAVDKALQSENGHLDLFLRFLLGLSMESNQTLLRSLLTQTGSSSHSKDETVQYIKEKIRENPSPEKTINLFYCLNELNDHSLVQEVQTYLNKGFTGLSGTKLSPAQWSAVAFVMLNSEEELDEFDLRKYDLSEECLLRLLPVLKVSRKAALAGCKLTTISCEKLSSVLQSVNSLKGLDLSNNDLQDSGVELLTAGLKSSHCKLEVLRLAGCNLTTISCEKLSLVLQSVNSSLKDLDVSNNDLQDSGVELITAGLKSSHCKLEILRLSGCMVTNKGCSALASALKSKPSHLRELDLSYNYPGEFGVLSDLLKDPHCTLEKLWVDHGGKIRIKPGPEKYAVDLTLDPNTVNGRLSLSERNRKVERAGEDQHYSDHPDRFDYWEEVLSVESLTGRCYWEVQWSGWGAAISVSYREIRRRGEILQPDILRSASEVVSDPGDQVGIDLHPCQLVFQSEGLNGVEGTGEIKEHDPHSAAPLVQMRVGPMEKWLMSFKEPEGQIARWLEELAPYVFQVEYRAGTQHANTDAMSRRPCAPNGCPYCEKRDARENELCSKEEQGPTQDGDVLPCSATRIINTPGWRAQQEQDSDLQPVLQRVESGQKPQWNEIAGCSPATKGLFEKNLRLSE